jgi:UDP-glucuronate decarboxylase
MGLIMLKNNKLNVDILNDSKEIIKNLGDKVNCFNDQKILITGAAGFLGAQFIHFFAYLNSLEILKKSCHVTLLDNFIRGKPLWISKISQTRNFTLINSDISKKKVFDRFNYDYIIHAASIASPSFYRKYPIQTMDANVIGLRNLLDSCANKNIKSFLYFSSSEIYGDPPINEIPTNENFRGNVSCTGPRACYDESKRFGETLCVNFWKEKGTPIKIARPFNNYGPGLNIKDKRVIPDIFESLIKEQNIILYSDGHATRTFCYIADAMTGYLQLLLSNQNGESFNIGTEFPEISIRKLAETILQISKKKNIKIINKKNTDINYLTDNPQRRCPDIKKARNLINFNPKISLQEGLLRTFKYYLR